MILLGWGWGMQRLSFYQVISFKNLEGDSGEGTPTCGGELDTSLKSPYHSHNSSDNAGLCVKPRLLSIMLFAIFSFSISLC